MNLVGAHQGRISLKIITRVSCDRVRLIILKKFNKEHHLKYFKLLLDADDPQKKFLYLQVCSDTDPEALHVTGGLGKKQFEVHDKAAMKKILDGSNFADCYYERKTVFNNTVTYVFKIERKNTNG